MSSINLFKIENILPRNNYNFLLSIFIYLTRKTTNLTTVTYYLETNDKKIIEDIYQSYYQLSTREQKEINAFIFKIQSEMENKEKIIEIILGKIDKFKFSYKINLYVYLERLKLITRGTPSYLSDIDNFSFADIIKYETLLMNYISIILKLPIFSNKDILDFYLKIQIFSFLYKRTSLQLNLYFNKLFIDVELFLQTDKYYCRLLDYYIISKKNMAVKINNILLVLFPDNIDDKTWYCPPDNCTSRLIRHKINMHLLEFLFKIKLNKNLAKVLKIEPEKLKTHKISFLNFIKR